MKAIRFTKNWNGKLNQRIFTTIRKCKANEDYYGEKAGNVFSVLLAGFAPFNARLISAKRYRFEQIPDELLALDTGHTDPKAAIAVFESFYGAFPRTDQFYILLFERVGVSKPNQPLPGRCVK